MENKNMFETFADMQKQAAETMTNAAETMQKAMFNSSSVDFNSDFFKKWYDNQMSWFNQSNSQNPNMPAFDFFNNWMKSQMDMGKNWVDMSQNMFKAMPAANAMNTDMNGMMGMFNSWKETMTGAYNQMMAQMNDGTPKSSFSGLFNNAEMFMKMYQFMMPMINSLQDKTYTPEMFKQMFNTSAYKDMMDKMFNMQPDFMKTFMGNMSGDMKANMDKMMGMNKSMFDTMKGNMQQQFNQMMPADMFGTMFNNYEQWYNQMNATFAPLTKIMPSNSTTQNMEVMKEMANMMAVYNMKNSQLQYMMYTTGLKAMDQFSEGLYTRMQNGEEFKSFMTIYQEWLNHNDKNFISLFETEEYSKLMSEVSAMQLTLKKKVEGQMEKAMAHLPIINRTEMDELYKTIYELRKRINTLEKQVDVEEAVSEEPKAAPKKAAKNSQ
jgi:BMFP domain-containing protein YqiC